MPKRYEKVACYIADQIQSGILETNDRILSVRQCADELGVSISTVIRGYEVLQDRMLIESRPQSGFFVCQQFELPQAPENTTPEQRPVEVNLGQLAVKIMKSSQDSQLIQLAVALPKIDVPAVAQLHRITAQIAREQSKPNRLTAFENTAEYNSPAGNKNLRRKIAQRLLSGGVSVHPDEIIITTGCQEALVLSLNAVTTAGDTVAVESPNYYGMLQAIETLGLKALEIPTDVETGISLSALELALREWPVTACVLAPNYSNPLGSCIPDDRKERLANMLEKANIALIEDDINAELTYGTHRPRAIKSYDKTGNVLLCSSLSKTLSPSLRVGWVVAGRWVEKVQHLKMCNSGANASITTLAATRYLETGTFDRHLRQMRLHYKRQRDYFLQLAARHFPDDIRMTNPQGGYILWIRLPKGVEGMALYERALEENIVISPGTLFSVNHQYNQFIRINYGQETRQRIERATLLLGRLMRELMKTKPIKEHIGNNVPI
ncbi:MAG: PLP-dependent aminotransferase family protein [Cocleimonas sp.]|nr:PLP-dependent aminotransferase family protein [Cocleimonas sp.]